MLKENKDYIEFVNICVSNFGDKEKDLLFEIYEMHFNADVAFLQSDYSRAFKSVYGSQKKQIDLYTAVLAKYYLADSKDILDKIAPGVIKSKNAAARLYLKLGYRDRATSSNYRAMADAAPPRLYSDKIFKYVDAIDLSRRAMRFAFLALFESRDIEMKKYIYSHLLEMEREKGNIFYNRFLSKTGEAFNAELLLSFDDYEVRYQKEMEAKKNEKPAAPADTKGQQAPAEPVFEKKVEREVRFRLERRVAEYIRDAEFAKANDIISKYVEDYDYKKIQATLETLAAREKETAVLDYERAKMHHADNYSRLTKPSVIETLTEKLKVRDDISKKPAPAQGDATDSQGKPAVTEGDKPAPGTN
jgi:hypothetical protein